MKLHLDGQILASEASRLQIGAANCNQRGGAAQSNVSPLLELRTLLMMFTVKILCHRLFWLQHLSFKPKFTDFWLYSHIIAGDNRIGAIIIRHMLILYPSLIFNSVKV